jgi:hypothetical protein
MLRISFEEYKAAKGLPKSLDIQAANLEGEGFQLEIIAVVPKKPIIDQVDHHITTNRKGPCDTVIYYHKPHWSVMKQRLFIYTQ